MTDMGLAKIETAKRNGQWDRPDRLNTQFDIPEELQTALGQNSKARAHFDQLAPTYRKQYVGWIAAAKRPETQEKRIKEAMELLEQGQKLGLR
ncbi:MAG: YdeI/OmpD-associated family protein [Candidatus Latescibacterota bacterium]